MKYPHCRHRGEHLEIVMGKKMIPEYSISVGVNFYNVNHCKIIAFHCISLQISITAYDHSLSPSLPGTVPQIMHTSVVGIKRQKKA